MKLVFAHSEPGKAVAYVHKAAMDLVKARRENGHSDKARGWKIFISLPACMYQVGLCVLALIDSIPHNNSQFKS